MTTDIWKRFNSLFIIKYDVPKITNYYHYLLTCKNNKMKGNLPELIAYFTPIFSDNIIGV